MELEALRTMNYEVAEAIAPTWERRRGFVEEISAPVWGLPERNPFFAVIAKALVERGHLPPPDPQPPGIFSLANEERLRALLEDAGFTEVRTRELPVRAGFADVDEYLEIVTDTAGPLAMALRELPDDERDAIRARVEQAFAPFAGAGGYEVPGAAVVAAAS